MWLFVLLCSSCKISSSECSYAVKRLGPFVWLFWCVFPDLGSNLNPSRYLPSKLLKLSKASIATLGNGNTTPTSGMAGRIKSKWWGMRSPRHVQSPRCSTWHRQLTPCMAAAGSLWWLCCDIMNVILARQHLYGPLALIIGWGMTERHRCASRPFSGGRCTRASARHYFQMFGSRCGENTDLCISSRYRKARGAAAVWTKPCRTSEVGVVGCVLSTQEAELC